LTQEKINKRLFVSLIVLIGATIALYFFSNRETAEKVDGSIFKVEDLKTIDRVTLESRSGKVSLNYKSPGWVVNDQYATDTRMVQVLFATLQQAEPRRPVASSIKDSVLTDLQEKGVTVSLFEGEQLVKSFVAGGNDAKTQSYFQDSKGDVYIVTIPGYRVYVSGIFELDESGFRDKYVFPFNWQNFKSLKAEFPEMPSENFNVLMDNDFFTIEGLASTDTSKLNTFLDDVSLLTCESYLSSAIADSLVKMKPQMVITIEDIANRIYTLAVYQPKGKNDVFGLINREPAHFDLSVIRAIIRPKSFFAKR
jgi:hypothetical protein